MTLYRACTYLDKIEAKEFAKVTEKFAISANGRRNALVSSCDSWHETQEAAIEAKRSHLQKEIDSAEKQLARTWANLAKFEQSLTVAPVS